MSGDPRYIVGELVEVGTPEGENQPRALIYCTEAEIRGVKQLPIMRRVAIVPLDLLNNSAVPPIVAECRRLRAACAAAREILRADPTWDAAVAIVAQIEQALEATQETPLPSDDSNP
jgi:hypothetical protein